MEIVTSPRLAGPSGWTRLAVGLGVLGPVTLLALLPVGLGLERAVVHSDAMAPDIPRGSVVLERQVPVAALRVGDVVTYRPPAGSGVEGTVTHRVVSIAGREVRTRGDARASLDPWVLPIDAPAPDRVVATLPHLGHAYLVLGRPAVAATLLAGSLVVWALTAAAARAARRPDAR